MSTLGNSTNIFWQECPVGKAERQKLLDQKGCVLWITGLSGSGFGSQNFLPYNEIGGLGFLFLGCKLRNKVYG